MAITESGKNGQSDDKGKDPFSKFFASESTDDPADVGTEPTSEADVLQKVIARLEAEYGFKMNIISNVNLYTMIDRLNVYFNLPDEISTALQTNSISAEQIDLLYAELTDEQRLVTATEPTLREMMTAIANLIFQIDEDPQDIFLDSPSRKFEILDSLTNAHQYIEQALNTKAERDSGEVAAHDNLRQHAEKMLARHLMTIEQYSVENNSLAFQEPQVVTRIKQLLLAIEKISQTAQMPQKDFDRIRDFMNESIRISTTGKTQGNTLTFVFNDQAQSDAIILIEDFSELHPANGVE